MVKRKSSFFDAILPLPHDLTQICLDYCCYRYCETCNDVFPSNFKCLSCTRTGGTYYTGGFTALGEEIKFDNFMDQLIWDYVQVKLPEGISVGSWIGSNKLQHDLQIRKQTRRNQRKRHCWAQLHPSPCGSPNPYKIIPYKQISYSNLVSKSRWTKTIE